MSWFLLILSGLLECAWAIGLKYSEGFTRLGPSLFTLVTLAASMALLALAARELPIGTAYAVWVGIGASLTVVVGMVTGEESVGLVRLLLLAGLVGCVVGLKLTH